MTPGRDGWLPPGTGTAAAGLLRSCVCTGVVQVHGRDTGVESLVLPVWWVSLAYTWLKGSSSLMSTITLFLSVIEIVGSA